MATLFDSTDVTVEIAFGDVPLETSPTWTDVTTYVRQVDIDRGRSSEFSDYSPGVATIVLDNRDRRFDPDHSSSPYVGDLVPMVPVRVTAQYSTGTTHVMFYGYVTGWPTAYNLSNTDAVSRIVAVDATRLLGNSLLPNTAYEDAVLSSSPYFYVPGYDSGNEKYDRVSDQVMTYTSSGPSNVLQEANRPVGDTRMIQSELSFATNNSPSTEANIQAVEFYYDPTFSSAYAFKWYYAAGDYFFVACGTGGGDYVAVGYSNSTTNKMYPSTASYFSVVLDTSNPLFSGGFEGINEFGTVHIAVVLEAGAFLDVYIEGVKRTSVSIVTGTKSLAGIDKDIVFDGTGHSHDAAYLSGYGSGEAFSHALAGRTGFRDELSSARLARMLDDAGWPSAWRDIDTGVQQVGAYAPRRVSASTYMKQVSSAEQGDVFVNRSGYVEMNNRTDVATSTPVGFFGDYLVDDLPITGVRVDGSSVDTVRNVVLVRGADVDVELSDATSVAAYGRSAQTIDVPLVEQLSQLRVIGQARLDRTVEPRTRITNVSVDVRADAGTLVDVLAPCELGDDVVVAFTPTGVGDVLWRAARVQGVSHSITPSSWQVAMYLAPGPTNENGPLLVLDHATYGELDAGNKLG